MNNLPAHRESPMVRKASRIALLLFWVLIIWPLYRNRIFIKL